MPKLYEYFGLIILFYSNEHEPVHVHGKYQGMESKAEIITDNGQIAEIRYPVVRGRKPLDKAKQKDFEILVEHFAEEIIQKWIDYFVMHKQVAVEKITRKLS
ncbi:MAG: DUF4160 domain-containing protein [Desulfamplus sp.]|nr:DUF4160 domain-containing protein [Desulfamplus sp.]